GEIHLAPGMAGRRSDMVGQSLRNAPARRIRSREPPPDAPDTAQGHTAGLADNPSPALRERVAAGVSSRTGEGGAADRPSPTGRDAAGPPSPAVRAREILRREGPH